MRHIKCKNNRNNSLKTEHYHVAFKINMAEGTNDCLKRFFFANGTFFIDHIMMLYSVQR